MTQQPQVIVLPESAIRTTGKNAQRNNIAAAKTVADTVKTTLGPKGMDKMLVDRMGHIVITNDGVTILEEMQIEHPAAKMMVEIARTQEAEVGDGTTTAVVLAGELLRQAEGLLDKNIHPTVIVKGYKLAADKAIEELKNFAQVITDEDTSILLKIAQTAMTGKAAEENRTNLATIAVEAVIKTENLDDIKLISKSGGSVADTVLVDGIVLNKIRCSSNMPEKVEDAKIALINEPLEIKHTEMETKININDPAQFKQMLEYEEEQLFKMVQKVTDAKANVLVCHEGIDDVAKHYLAKAGIYALQRIERSDMEKLAKASGAKIVTRLEELSYLDLGSALIVEEAKVGYEKMTFISGCSYAKSVTILVRASTEHVVNEIERALTDAIGDVNAAIRGRKVVAGAGSPELELSRRITAFADTLSGREQLAVRAFADALEVIPRTLAENAGLDPIDTMAALKAAHESLYSKPEMLASRQGINVFTGKVMDAWAEGVLEPMKVKTQAISSATEVATLLLRIDDVIASGREPSATQ